MADIQEKNPSVELDTDGVNDQTIEVETPTESTTEFEKKEDVDLLMDGKKADMVFTDPPYGIKRSEGFEGKVGFNGNNKPTKRKLKKKVAGTTFTLDEAIRIYLWTNEDYDIPGISKRDQKTLVDFVKEDADLVSFAEGVKLVTRKDQYLKPTEFWDASTILGDLGNVANSINRAEYLKEFIDNAKVIFSDTNLNKIQAI